LRITFIKKENKKKIALDSPNPLKKGGIKGGIKKMGDY